MSARRRTFLRRTSIVAAAGAALAVGAIASPVAASATVTTTPAANTPQVLGTGGGQVVRKLVACNGVMYAVGSFSQVKQVAGNVTFTRHNAFSFNISNGLITKWNPNANGEVNSVAVNSDCSRAWLGGSFSQAGGISASHLVKTVITHDSNSGNGIGSDTHKTNGAVETLSLVDGGQQLMVGGRFTSIANTPLKALASIGASHGTPDNYFAGSISGSVTSTSTQVYNSQLSPHGHDLLIEGNFTTITGRSRQQIAMLQLESAHAVIRQWVPPDIIGKGCATDEAFYMRAAAWGPGGTQVYVAATGFHNTSPYCDAVTAFRYSDGGFLWSNPTSGDSLYSVAASPTDVYVGGHERHANGSENPGSAGYDSDDCTYPGCVDRQGIGDIGSVSGKATSWNPTRSRGAGADDLLVIPSGTGQGLWVASDTGTVDSGGTVHPSTTCAGRYHPGICYFPR